MGSSFSAFSTGTEQEQDKDFRVELPHIKELHILEDRVEKQQQLIPTYTKAEKLDYVKKHLEYFIKRYEWSHRAAKNKIFFEYATEKNIYFAITTKELQQEAVQLLKFVSPEATINERYEALNSLGLTDILFHIKFRELTPLFLKLFRTEPNKILIQVLKKYTLHMQKEKKIPLHEYFDLSAKHHNEHIKQAFGMAHAKSIADVTSKNISIIKTLSSLLAEGIPPQELTELCDLLNINPLTQVTFIDAAAIRYLTSQPAETIETIKKTQLEYMPSRSMKEKTTAKKVQEFGQMIERGFSRQASYEKITKKPGDTITDKAIIALNNEIFTYQSDSLLDLVAAMKIAIRFGATDIKRITFTKAKEYKSAPKCNDPMYLNYLRYIQLAHALSAIEVTTLEIAKRMVITANSINECGYLDIFSLKMLESIPSDDIILQQTLEHAAEKGKKLEAQAAGIIAKGQLELLTLLEKKDLLEKKQKIIAMEEMVKKNPLQVIALRLQQTLANVKLHAQIIVYEDLLDILQDLTTKDLTAEAQVIFLKDKVKLCIECISTIKYKEPDPEEEPEKEENLIPLLTPEHHPLAAEKVTHTVELMAKAAFTTISHMVKPTRSPRHNAQEELPEDDAIQNTDVAPEPTSMKSTFSKMRRKGAPKTGKKPTVKSRINTRNTIRRAPTQRKKVKHDRLNINIKKRTQTESVNALSRPTRANPLKPRPQTSSIIRRTRASASAGTTRASAAANKITQRPSPYRQTKPIKRSTLAPVDTAMINSLLTDTPDSRNSSYEDINNQITSKPLDAEDIFAFIESTSTSSEASDSSDATAKPDIPPMAATNRTAAFFQEEPLKEPDHRGISLDNPAQTAPTRRRSSLDAANRTAALFQANSIEDQERRGISLDAPAPVRERISLAAANHDAIFFQASTALSSSEIKATEASPENMPKHESTEGIFNQNFVDFI